MNQTDKDQNKEKDISSKLNTSPVGDTNPPLSSIVLLVTASKIETQAVHKVFTKGTKADWTRKNNGNKTYYHLGSHGGVSVWLVQTEMGTGTPGGSLLTVYQAIEDLQPQAIIMCGIAFGFWPDKQHIGDILVAKQLKYYGPQKIDSQGGTIQRGDCTTSSELLLDRFRSADNEWKDPRTHFGLVLSGEILVNDPNFRDQLLKFAPEAIGGEMEGAGLYAAARIAKVDWILVKAICDWADGKKDDYNQSLAAENAAKFVLFTLERGVWENFEPNKPISSITPPSLNDLNIAQEMISGFPSRKYLELTKSISGWQEHSAPMTDPFACDVDTSRRNKNYVFRHDIEDDILSSGSFYIIGCEGSGKTTLVEALSVMQRNRNLVVILSIDERVFESGTSPLALPSVIYNIFNTFWNNLFLDVAQRKIYYSKLRINTRWRAGLHWFYTHFRPQIPDLPDEDELTAWLNSPPRMYFFSDEVTSKQVLCELVNLITGSTYNFPKNHVPYKEVVIMLDIHKDVSSNINLQILEDVQHIIGLNVSNLMLKIFVDTSLESQIRSQRCVLRNRVHIIRMPRWSKELLTRLLARRILEFEDERSDQTLSRRLKNWGALLPLEPLAQANIVDLIVEGALRIYKKDSHEISRLDAPIHALRLARGLLSASAGCWVEYGFTPPLKLHQLQRLVEIYWQYY